MVQSIYDLLWPRGGLPLDEVFDELIRTMETSNQFNYSNKAEFIWYKHMEEQLYVQYMHSFMHSERSLVLSKEEGVFTYWK
jgi:hypothetical protein